MIEFGKMPNGDSVKRLNLKSKDLDVALMSYGAGIQDLRLNGHDFPLVLGFKEFQNYLNYSQYYGTNAGRVINRLANANVTIAGKNYPLEANFKGLHTLHGSSKGIGKQNWAIKTQEGNQSVTFSYTEPDLFAGFPGNLAIECEYRLIGDHILQISFKAKTDKSTLCNLAHHSYFNLDGTHDTRHHQLEILAENYLPTNDDLIPTGEIVKVENSVYDFRRIRNIWREDPLNPNQLICPAIDNNYCLKKQDKPELREIATLKSTKSGITMKILSDQIGVQFYAGAKVNSQVSGLTDHVYGPFAGLCLEPQIWPDAPNHVKFPSIELHPDQTYHQTIQFIFS